MLVYVADEYSAFEAGAGAKTLEASIVRLYVVLMISGWFLGGWVRWMRGRLSRVHWGPFPLAWRSRFALVGAGASSCLYAPYNITFNSV
jgi:hypothetical protein